MKGESKDGSRRWLWRLVGLRSSFVVCRTPMGEEIRLSFFLRVAAYIMAGSLVIPTLGLLLLWLRAQR